MDRPSRTCRLSLFFIDEFSEKCNTLPQHYNNLIESEGMFIPIKCQIRSKQL